MKGNPYKLRMKTKTVHGVRTGEHNNPHVMASAKRADGGVCDGDSAPRNLGRIGRTRRPDGGSVPQDDAELRTMRDRLEPMPLPPPPPPLGGAISDRDASLLRPLLPDLGTIGPMRGPGPDRMRRACGGAVQKADGGPLTTKERNALPKKSFALPGRRYPINDANHARNALSRVAQNGTPEEKSAVRGAVKRKFPGIGQKKASGGEVSDTTVGSKELKQHALEHKALAAAAKKGS